MIAKLKIQMENACIADNDARADNRPATQKLMLLPQVMSVLNRNDIQETVLDPETNFLQSIRFFLEPLNDGSLPAFQIQQEVFKSMMRLPIEKDALLSSGIGKVVLFYTRSRRAQVGVKRMAERLLGEWSRPILKRTDDYKKRYIETREFDNRYVPPSPPFSAMRDGLLTTVSPVWPRGLSATAASSRSASVRRRRSASRPSETVPWLPSSRTPTAPLPSASRGPTLWLRRAHLTRWRALPTTDPLAPVVWKRSGR